MNERDKSSERRRKRRLDSLAEALLADPTGSSEETTQRNIGLGSRAAEDTKQSVRKAIGDVKRGSQSSDQTSPLMPSDNPSKAENDMAAWIASIRGGLDPIEMGSVATPDHYNGLDIDDQADVEEGQEALVSNSMGTRTDDPASLIEEDYDYSGLPNYMQADSKFRTALSAVEADDYDTMFGNAETGDTPFKGTYVSQMSMSEVFDLVKGGGAWNKYNKKNHDENTTAIGKYQMVGATLRDLKSRGELKKLGITDDTKFNKKTQDMIAMHLAERRVKPNYSEKEARQQIRNEWAGFENLTDPEVDLIVQEIRGLI